jgi:regulator of sigma E protease
MEILAQIQHYGFWFLVALTVLVFIHELGHFLVARWCGVRVEVFSIGFGPELFGFSDKTGTRWKVSWLPLGGYVRMFGQDDSVIEGEAARPMTAAERAVSFKHKSVGRRMAIVAAGPAANFLFAVVVLALIYGIVGQRHSDPVIGTVTPNSAAAQAGLQAGDRILALNGNRIDEYGDIDAVVQLNLDKPLDISLDRSGQQLAVTAHPVVVNGKDPFGNPARIVELGTTLYLAPIVGEVVSGSAAEAAGLKVNDRIVALNDTPVTDFTQVVKFVRDNGDRPIAITVDRSGARVTLTAVPRMVDAKDESGQAVKMARLGISAADTRPLTRLGPVAAVVSAGGEVVRQTEMMLTGIWQMVSGQRPSDEVRGVIGIAQMAGDVAELGLVSFIMFGVMLSINLGMINLFPVPMLDGGHLIYYAVELVRGKPLGERAQEYGLRIGLALVLSLMLFATWNDLVYLKVVDSVKSLFM